MTSTSKPYPISLQKSAPPVVLLMRHAGMTVLETYEYLVARGVTCTLSAAKAWARGAYSPPTEAMIEIGYLIDCLHDASLLVPEEAPQFYRDLRRVVLATRRWTSENASGQAANEEHS